MVMRKILLEKHIFKKGRIVYFDYGFTKEELKLPGYRWIEKCIINRIWKNGMELKICNSNASYIGIITDSVPFDADEVKTKVILRKIHSQYGSF